MNKERRALMFSTSMAFVFWGIIGTIGPLAASGSIIGNLSKTGKLIFLLAGPVTVPFGNLIMGILADFYGRRRIFLLTMASYTIGIIIISISSSFIPLLIGLIFAQFGVGGEEPSSLSLVGEEMEKEQRPKWLTILTNFDNIGSALMALLFFVVVNNFSDRVVLLASSLILIASMIYLRVIIPESKIWERSRKGKRLQESFSDLNEKANPEVSIDSGERKNNPRFIFSFIFFGVIAVSQYLTFGLMAYVLAPIEFPGSTTDELIIFIAMLGASIGGFFAVPLISRGTKSYTLFSFFFGTLTMVVILILLPYLSNMVIFLPLLFANMFASEFAYASRSVLEPELYGTNVRSTSIGLTRLWPMIAYPLFTYYTSSLNLEDFLLINLILWSIGFAATIVWFLHGIETKNMSLEYNL